MILKGLKERLKNRFNIALVEEDHFDLWQRSRIALVSVSRDKQTLMNLQRQILDHIENNDSVQVIEVNTEYF